MHIQLNAQRPVTTRTITHTAVHHDLLEPLGVIQGHVRIMQGIRLFDQKRMVAALLHFHHGVEQ